MVDWTIVSSLATAGGTLVLAVATFASVRSGSRAARTAERALQIGLRPVLFASRSDDLDQKIRWGDDHWARLGGGRATVELVGGIVYLAMSLRNVGAGIAVLHGWRAETDRGRLGTPTAPEVTGFRPQQRDLYVPAGDISFWQAAIRQQDDPDLPGVVGALEGARAFGIDLLYGDHEGGQRAITRFAVVPMGEDQVWLCSAVRHWNLDRQNPR